MNIQELLLEEMKDQYDAEKQLVKALPQMVKAASSPELSQAISNHLEETRGHVQRLEQAFTLMGAKARGKSCEAMKGLVEEAKETIGEDMPEELLDSAIIAAAQKVEHYEIAGYGTMCAWARAIGMDDVAELLQQTLQEEKAADEKLTEVAETILASAAEETGEEEEAPVNKKVARPQTATAGGRRQVG